MWGNLLNKINRYLESGWYVFTVSAVCVVFWCLGKYADYTDRNAALAFTYAGVSVVIAMGCAVLLLRRDLTPVIANVLLVSYSNSVYNVGKGFVTVAIVLVPVIAVCVGLHVWLWYFRNKPEGGFRFTFGKLKWSWVAVLAVTALAGLGCSLYDFKHTPLILLMSAGMLALYLFVLNFTTGSRDFVMWTLFAVGAAVSVELLFYYAVDGGDFFDKLVDRRYSALGWSKSVNAVCTVLFIGVPPALYLAVKSRLSPLFVAGAALMVLNGFFTLSRGNLLTGAIVFLPLAVYALLRAEYRGRTMAAAFLSLSVVAILFGVFYDDLNGAFSRLFHFGNGSGRLPIWERAAEYFRKYPVFGTGYIGSNGEVLDAPGLTGNIYKVHNNFLQILMCTGVVGFLGVVFHYGQKLWLFRSLSLFKVFAAATLLVIEGDGLVDLTMTTGYIVLYVYVLLAAAEKEGAREPVRLPEERAYR